MIAAAVYEMRECQCSLQPSLIWIDYGQLSAMVEREHNRSQATLFLSLAQTNLMVAAVYGLTIVFVSIERPKKQQITVHNN